MARATRNSKVDTRTARAKLKTGKRYWQPISRGAAYFSAQEPHDQYPIELSNINEFGVLAESIDAFDSGVESDDEPGRRFAEEINKRLAISRTKDVYIYVHGYKVTFENPVLVAMELWHFLGYNRAFIAYSWPSTPKTLAYFEDLDDAVNSARSLRTLILYIADHTDAEKIHVLGYSAGIRAVTRMLADFGMYGWFMEKETIDQRLKLGNIILIRPSVRFTQRTLSVTPAC